MRGRRNKYYTYIQAKSLADVQKLEGRNDLMVFRPQLTGMAGTVDSDGGGDYTCLYEREGMWYDKEHERYRMMTPDVAMIRDRRSRLERETNLARKYVEKACKAITELSVKHIPKGEKSFPQPVENFYDMAQIIFDDHDAMKRRRSGMDRIGNRRFSWHEKRMPEASERDWLLGNDDAVALYAKMEMQEFKQYAYTLRMHKYIMRKFSEFVDIMMMFAEENDFHDEFEQFIVDEFNRLAVQVRQEQERRIK